jgi:beta-galactosidase
MTDAELSRPERHPTAVDRMWARLGRLGYGADYNPEQWPASTWTEDTKLMQAAGVNIVSLGIFAWAQLEKQPGEYDFGWLDEVMDRLHEAGVSVCLATATASPPPWLARLHPDTLPVTRQGTRLWPGSRQHYCPSSKRYREAAGQLVRQLARRYATHPALAIWHIGNEFGCHVSDCYCDNSADDFRRWLQERYGDLDTLNERWSTTFWSQRYADWAEINPPRQAPTFANPAQQLDFARFSSDALRACYQAEKDILAEITPDIPVTTNLLSLWKPVDYFSWAPGLDVIANDSYPDPHDEKSIPSAAMIYDLMRSLHGGQPWMLMEQAPSAVNWRAVNGPKPPGVMRLWSCQAVAHGADAVMFFQWRAARGGAEKYHSALVPHGGTHTRTWREVSEFGQELAELAPVLGSRVTAQTALLLDWSSWWALELDSHPSTRLLQTEALRRHHTPLWQDNIATDVVHPEADLSGYRLVVVPNLYLITDRAAENLRDYVAAGGRLVVSFFSGIVDENDRVRLGGYPAPLRELLGLRVEEFWPLADGTAVDAAFGAGEGGTSLAGETPYGIRGMLWADAIELEGAEAVASYTGGPLPGRPAVTRHEFGSGTVWYLGTCPDEVAMRRITREAAAAAGVAPVLPGLPDSVEATRRDGPSASYLFLLNHGTEAVTVPLPEPAAAVFGDGDVDDVSVRLPARGVSVLRQSRSE